MPFFLLTIAKTMKLKYWLILFSSVTILAFNACTSNSKKVEIPSIYNAQDTTLVQNMVTAYLEQLKAKEYDQALDMLSTLKTDSVVSVQPLSEEERMQLKKQFDVFPVLNYKLESEDWTDDDHIVYTYLVEFFEKEPGSDIPNTVKLVLNPFRKDGRWYLTNDTRRL